MDIIKVSNILAIMRDYPPNSAIFIPTWVITSLNSLVGLKSINLTSSLTMAV